MTLRRNMKNVISMKINKIFDLQKTGMPFYDSMIKEPECFEEEKKLMFEIKNITTLEYFELSAEAHKSTVTREYLMISHNNIKNIKDWIDKGNKLPIPVIDFVTGIQEGRHRAVIADLEGLKSIPVMLIKEVS